MLHEPEVREETLDPEDWSEMRVLAHRMVDDMFSQMETLRDRPAWQPMPDEVQASFHAPLPQNGQPVDVVYDDFKRNVLAYPMGNPHPRFWGWVMGNGTPLGMMAEMLAAGMNPNMGGGDHAGSRVELQVIDWCKEMFGYPAEASGLLLSGGSMANLIGLAVARHARSGFDIREEGVAAAPRPMTIYGSVEMHSSLQRGVEVLGLGNRSLRRIPVDDNFKIDLQVLRQAIDSDIAQGMQPICLVGNAGAVNTGAIDPLDELADIAAQYSMWFHVDGAFGSLAALSPELRPRLKGMERSDSLAFDLHKWFYLPFEAGCVIVRDREAHLRTFTLTPAYLAHGQRGLAGGEIWLSDYGIQLTRGFKALKVWMAFKTHGVEKIGRLIRQNVNQAGYLAGLVKASPCLELLAPVELNVVCFRFTMPGLDDQKLDDLNKEVLLRLHETGVAIPSGTLVKGQYAIRCAITNHRSRREDFSTLVSETVRIGERLVAEGWKAG